jgi:hypothetical protein
MSKHHYHAVVWIDHHEARVFHFSPTDVERHILHPDHPTRHIHHKPNSIGSGHASEDHDYLHAVAEGVQTPAQFSLQDQPMQRPSWLSTFITMIRS